MGDLGVGCGEARGLVSLTRGHHLLETVCMLNAKGSDGGHPGAAWGRDLFMPDHVRSRWGIKRFRLHRGNEALV